MQLSTPQSRRLPAARAVSAALAGQLVRSLYLSAANAHPFLKWNPATASFGTSTTPGAVEERAALAACLQLGTQLEELTVAESTHPSGIETEEAADWLLSMPRLRCLNHLGDGQQLLHLPSGLSRLTQLEHADLDGAVIVLHDLPRSLTSLQLWESEAEELPEQLAVLSQLQRLNLYAYEHIDTCSGSPSCTRLAVLSRLTHLGLRDTPMPPADCLGSLTCLRQLAIEMRQFDGAEDRKRLENALASCRQLTLLSLTVRYDEELAGPGDLNPTLRIPRSVAQLHNLRAFLFSIECYGSARIDTSLPAGPWLQQLHWLALPWSMALQQADTLAACTPALRRIFLSAPPIATEHADSDFEEVDPDFEEAYAHHLPAFESFVANHPALECVYYAAEHVLFDCLPPRLVQLLVQLAEQRAALTVAGAPASAFYPTDFPAFLDEPDLFGRRY